MLRLIKSPAGALIARPWFDRVAAYALRRWYIPVSRYWAAASISEGELDAFLASLGDVKPTSSVTAMQKAISQTADAARARRDAEAQWEAMFFGTDDIAPGVLAAIEESRLQAATAHNMMRRALLWARFSPTPEPVMWSVSTPDEVAGLLGTELTAPQAVLGSTLGAPPRRTLTIPGSGWRKYWLRFPSPWPRLENESVTAWVWEPDGVADPPTLIWGHGLCMDPDHWAGLREDVQVFVDAGIRVIRPEAAWHGRRVPDGEHAGERFIGASPLGAVDCLAASTVEWRVLIDWARSSSNGPVAIGGISLGAMTAQLVAAKARYWPKEHWPDAMLLVTHCASMWHAHDRGILSDVWGSRRKVRDAGWDEDKFRMLAHLAEPLEAPTVAPDRIVSLLGDRDKVTPFESARQMLSAWQVPERNIFVRRQGHFSIVLGLLRDNAPLRAFAELLREATG